MEWTYQSCCSRRMAEGWGWTYFLGPRMVCLWPPDASVSWRSPLFWRKWTYLNLVSTKSQDDQFQSPNGPCGCPRGRFNFRAQWAIWRFARAFNFKAQWCSSSDLLRDEAARTMWSEPHTVLAASSRRRPDELHG